jgi:hypothetical protein
MDDRDRHGFGWGVTGSAFQSEGHVLPCNWRVYLLSVPAFGGGDGLLGPELFGCVDLPIHPRLDALLD